MRDANLVSTALQLRWPWLQRIEVDKPWASFRIHFISQVLALFRKACSSVVENGRSTIFWTGNWIGGKSIEFLAPVGRRATRQCSIADALVESAWIQDISGPLNAQGMVEFLQLKPWQPCPRPRPGGHALLEVVRLWDLLHPVGVPSLL